VAAWCVVSFVAAFMGRSMKPAYYLQMVPALVVLTAMAIPHLRHWNRYVQLALLAAALVSIHSYANRSIRPINTASAYWDDVDEQVLTYINEHTSPDDCL